MSQRGNGRLAGELRERPANPTIKERLQVAPVRPDDEVRAWTVTRAVVRIGGVDVAIEVGIPVKVLEALERDKGANRGPWRASFTSGVAVRVAGGSPRTETGGAVDRKGSRPNRDPRKIERRDS